MNYPLISEYIDSILCAEDNFATLTHLRPVLDHEGNPIMSSGNFAVVFKMRDERTKKEYAVKCFTKDQEGRSRSYKRISDFLKGINSQYLVNFQYCEDELFVDTSVASSDVYPIVLMDWVTGTNLTNYINSILYNKQELCSLLLEFKDFLIWMLDQPFAHGDLKPDNILINQAGKIVLVDYDGMYVPSMHGENAREYGSPDFRNPHKEFEKFNEDMDVFSLISIYSSLALIAYDSMNLMKFSSSDRLLFSVSDYYDFQNCDIYRYIQNTFSNDGKIMRLAEILILLCEGKKLNSSVIGEIRRILANNITINKKGYIILPSPEVYIEAMQNYVYSLGNAKNLEPIIVNNQVLHIKGANSIVFKMYDRMSKKYYALKCYTNIDSRIYNRLQSVSQKIKDQKSKYLVKFQVINNAIDSNYFNKIIGEENSSYPVILMDWIEGDTLYKFLYKNDLSKENYEKVIRNFSKMSSWLLEQNFSHGDLSPQNILITSDNNIKLVDYDNVIFKNETDIPSFISNLKDENFYNPVVPCAKFEDNIDNFALVSLWISLIYKFETVSRCRAKYFYAYNWFFKKEDFKDIENSSLFKSVNKCSSWEYDLSTFVLCLKQHLRSITFKKEELIYLFKKELSRETTHYLQIHEGPNGKLEKNLINYASFCSVISIFMPFILVTCTQWTILGVSLFTLVASVVHYMIMFTVASLRPDKTSRLRLSDDDHIAFGCLGSIATFLPVLFMSDIMREIVNNNISWINIPIYNEPWYITALIWFMFFVTSQIFLRTFVDEMYDYDTLVFDLRNRKYENNREKFINRISEDEYNYNYSKDFKDSRLYNMILVNLIVLLGMIYALYRFFVLHDDLVMTNVIISVLTCCSTLLVKPILKDKYSMYSHKAKRQYTVSIVTKMFLPLITIPFAFSGITDFLNGLLGSSFPPYDLGLKELIINTVLYLIIFYNPILKEEYL